MTNTVTVNCTEGLDALPEGTELNLLSDSHYVVKNARGTFNWSRSGFIDGQYATDADSMTKGTGWLPATVMNPEILGEFHKPNPFEVGDRVVKATTEHYIAQGREDYDYEEREAPKGHAGTVTGISSIFGAGRALNVSWDEPHSSSVISPDNLNFEPRLGDKVRITEGDGCGLEWGAKPVGTLVPRNQANLHRDNMEDGYADHHLAVDVGTFVYLVKAVEFVERGEEIIEETFEPSHVIDLDGDVWVENEGDDTFTLSIGGSRRSLDYIDATYGIDNGVEEEPEPTFEAGDRVVIQGAPMAAFAGIEAVVNASSTVFGTHLTPVTKRPDGYGLSPFYWPSDDLVKVETIIEDFEIEVGATVHDDEGLDLLPSSTVISINAIDSLGSRVYVPRTKMGDQWGWPNKYGSLDSQDEMTRAAVREHGATIVHLN